MMNHMPKTNISSFTVINTDLKLFKMSSQSFSSNNYSLLALTITQSITQDNNQKYLISQSQVKCHSTCQEIHTHPSAHHGFHLITTSKALSFEMLLQWSKKMEVTGCKGWAVWWMDNMFSVKLVQKFSCDRNSIWKFLC
jgi:hypothetical protein